jgi:hypothetical protein
LLKSPNRTNKECVGLEVEVLDAIAEKLAPGVAAIALRGTPIVDATKTPNSYPIYI